MSGNPLATLCPCGHEAFHHPSPEQQAARLAATEGRYAVECNGRKGNPVNQFGPIACRCVVDRGQVIAAALVEEPTP